MSDQPNILDNIDKIDDITQAISNVKVEDMSSANEDDTEVLGDKQKNLILQVIGQLKVGMDLTKVLIPVDFLEDRSLLEKLTDLLTHCDIICKYV